MAEPGPRERLISAAIALFDEKGYDAVTVEAIAQRAEVGRTTLFRLFGSKEGLVFPDHDALLANAERSRPWSTPPVWCSPTISRKESWLGRGGVS